MDSHKRNTQLERLEVVETGRRRRWSDGEKLRIVTESFQAPRAISSTTRRHGISRSLLMTWRRSFGPEPISPQGEQSGFARVVCQSSKSSSSPLDAIAVARCRNFGAC
jgi:transposase